MKKPGHRSDWRIGDGLFLLDDAVTWLSDNFRMGPLLYLNQNRGDLMNLMNATPEPFDVQRQAQTDNAEYQFGFQAAMHGELNNTSQTLAWHRGWADAQELRVTATLIPAS